MNDAYHKLLHLYIKAMVRFVFVMGKVVVEVVVGKAKIEKVNALMYFTTFHWYGLK